MCTWNVEGLSEVKLEELERIMREKGIDVLCMQETHIAGADSYISDAGSLIILSGGVLGEREYAGVGFIVSPFIRRFVIGFVEHEFAASHFWWTVGSNIRVCSHEYG